jgi:prevent-host-death family protein
MARSTGTPPTKKTPRGPGTWPLQDAKARFSELVRRAHNEGPKIVTVPGREEVVVVSASAFHRLTGDQTGGALIAAMPASPCRDTRQCAGSMCDRLAS